MRKRIILLICMLLLALNGNLYAGVQGPPIKSMDEESQQKGYNQWMDHVLKNYDLSWEQNEAITIGEQCIIDGFDDGSLAPLWLSYADPGITVEEDSGVAKIYGITNPWYYSGGAITQRDPVQVQSFTAKIDVKAVSGAFGGPMHRGEHFSFFAVGDNGHYVGIQYWAEAYRISWDDGYGWQRIYSPENGDEMTTWYTWKIVYNADTKEANVYVNDRQIGGTAIVNLGTTFRTSYSVVATLNSWIEGLFDNFSLCYKAEDTAPPEITIDSIYPQILWPPNGKMVDVNILGSAVDSGSGGATVVIDTVDEYGKVQPSRTGFGSIPLEAWREGNDRDGRSYTIKITATDNAGNAAIKYIKVIVPHDVGLHQN